MSTIEFRNNLTRAAVHVATDRRGDLRLHDRFVTRGRGARQASATTFEAIFTFDDPLTCPSSEVPENGVYFLEENGMAEVIQLSGRFASCDEREAWLETQFGSGNGR